MFLKDEKSQWKHREYKEEPNRNLKTKKKKKKKGNQKNPQTYWMVLITEWRWQSTTEVKNKSLKVFQFELLNEKKLGKKINSASHVW